MPTSWKSPLLLGFGLVLAACQSVPPGERATAAREGHAFAQASCARRYATGASCEMRMPLIR